MRSLMYALFLIPLWASAAQNTPDEATATLWRALSNDPGASADVASLQRLFHDDAVVFGGHYKAGVASMRRTAIKDFLKSQENISSKGFYECEVSREVKAYDRFAVVYSVVESRSDKSAIKPNLVGVNSIQLYKDGTQWRILSLYYHVEKQGLPISPGNAQTGKCLG